MLNRLLGKLATKGEEVDDRTDEEVAADEKKARIKYHRDHVRNGPQKVRYITSGQQRRAVARGQKAQARKATRRHKRAWMDSQRNRAVLRAQLQAIGAVSYATDYVPTEKQRVDAGVWIVRAFGERDEDGKLVESDDLFSKAVEAALAEYQGKVAA